ncbi:NAD-dependent epimerase/dehydratase family protein [Pontibacillus yanchengensis]|uniref:UDP-glucose 4-epimerase n=1 Tax=Pontibacillus yanchengensis Y32 TaxID=1385514 RepID=A0A0A2TGT0_9BACI|nr:NAD-dependent epimerase/dehydratase family protein [Pontibacillus yanchengensis]KGP73331.1 UDP-glucose 4-epimerase [Pontibacillus yanchengensis Y32]
MKVLVTGGAGFIGSHVVKWLIHEGHSPIVLDNLSSGKKEHLPDSIPIYQIDVASDEVINVFKEEQPDAVIHMAAQTDVTSSILQPEEDIRTNVLGTIKLLSCAKEYNIKQFIFSSSCAVYGEHKGLINEQTPTNPISIYGVSKLAAETYIKLFHHLYDIPYTIFRYGNVYGPRQDCSGEGGVVAIFIRNLLDNQHPIIYGNGHQTRDFVYVQDVAIANERALTAAFNDTFTIGSSQTLSVNDLYHLLTRKIPGNHAPIYKPEKDGDIQECVLDYAKANKYLNWTPSVNMHTGIDETINWMKKTL